MWTQRVTRTNPQNRSSWSMRKTRKGITNKELLTWKWDLPPPPSFWHERRNGEGMQTFSEQPSGQTFPQKTASHTPVPDLVSKQAYLLKFLRSVHTHVRGFRSPFLKDPEFLDDFSVNARNADIFKISSSMFFYSSFTGADLGGGCRGCAPPPLRWPAVF